MRRLPIRKLWLGFIAVIVPVVFATAASGQGGLTLMDLEGPRGLSQDGSVMLIAEQGTGQVLQVTQQGTRSVVVKGLPTSTFIEDGVPVATGPTTAINVGGTIFVSVGEAPGEKGFDSVYTAKPGQAPKLLADLLAYETANNADGGIDMEGKPELLVNAYDLVSDNAGGVLVSASGANAIFRVTGAGVVSTYAVFEDRTNPLFPQVGGPTYQQVPTGIERGPDGAVYVSMLTGFPFLEGGARVYRLADSNSDGDAMDSGEATVYAEGLTTATNLAFDTDGSLLVTEFHGFLSQAEKPGRVVRVTNGKISGVVAEPLLSPTGITVFDGEIIVTQEFLGIVSEAKAGAAIFASLPPPPGQGGITPPNTGDGGLAGNSGSSAVLLAVAFVAAGLFGAGVLARAQR